MLTSVTSVTWKIKAQNKAFIQILLLRLRLSPEKIKNPAVVENMFFSIEPGEVGTCINLCSFESSMKLPFVKSLITQNEPNNLFTNSDFEGMTL